MTGFAMKVLIADMLLPLVDAVYALPSPSGAKAWAGALAYTLQLFFDFAGYSAMAIGLAMMIGFHFPENFADPYLAGSIQEFWQRWHMTLSRFLRDYLYISLGGIRGGAVRTYLKLMATMVIGGFWHGESWTFIVSGCWHGGLLALHRFWRASGAGPLPYALGLPVTFLCVVLGWVVFRAHDIQEALRIYAALAGQNGWSMTDALAWQILPEQYWVLILGLVPPCPAWPGQGCTSGADPATDRQAMVRGSWVHSAHTTTSST